MIYLFGRKFSSLLLLAQPTSSTNENSFQIKGKRAKNKGMKRKSDEDGQSAHKVQKTDQEKESSDGAAVETVDLTEQGDANEQEDGNEQEGSEVFDYEKADYSLFQKAKNKAQKKQKVKEMFKGKVCYVS